MNRERERERVREQEKGRGRKRKNFPTDYERDSNSSSELRQLYSDKGWTEFMGAVFELLHQVE